MIKPKARRHSEEVLAIFKKDYATLATQKDDNIKKMQKLLTKKNVTEYFNLMNANKKITEEQRVLYKKIKNIEYQNCQHLWVNVPNWDFYNEQGEPNICKVICKVCLKCGLNENVLLENKTRAYFYNYEDEVMYQFMQSRHYEYGLVVNEPADLAVAKEVYARIKANHLDIEDEQVKKYMEIALHNMNLRMQDEASEEKVLKRLFSKKN